MAERPILFQGAMVRALLAGTKTQTRRAVRPSSGPHTVETVISTPDSLAAFVRNRCPYGQPGDRLWVRESFAHIYRGNELPETRRPDDVAYMADGYTVQYDVYGPWKPSIHMPRWASRLTLEITAVRVERLQDISEADAKAEGTADYEEGVDAPPPEADCEWSYRAAYLRLWESINGRGSWDANPWVWVVEFKVVTS